MAAIRATIATTASITPRSQIAGRAVHIKIHPRPRNIFESRQVLRVLERFGEVVTLIDGITTGGIQYEPQAPAPNTALAIYQHEKAATDLLDASPVRFVLEVDDRGETVAPAHALANTTQTVEVPAEQPGKDGTETALKEIGRPGLPGADEMAADFGWGFLARKSRRPADAKAKADEEADSPPSTEPEKRSNPSSNTRPPPPQEHPHREFQLTISRSHLNHQAYIERQAYYGPFNPDSRSIMAEDLEHRVPLKGLADCKMGKEEIPLRIRQKRKEREAEREWVGLKGLWEMGQTAKQGLGTPGK
ncbi:hypothetical protein MMC08_004083 [Hypocenomyce scalaris]|nr:hypothetical protein [Hypocenomyce scalaris]